MTRPYISLSIAQLEFLASDDPSDASSVSLLIDELRHRNGRRVRRLLSQLETPLVTENNDEDLTEEEPVTSTFGPVESPNCPDAVVRDNSPVQSAGDHELIRQRYEDLRLTFTVEAELLARWGMTPSMPQSMQEMTFAEWRKRLQRGADTLGRSVQTLEADQLRIADERRLHQTQGLVPRGMPAMNEKAK